MRRVDTDTLVAAAPARSAVPGLAALAFGSAGSLAPTGEGRHLAFLPLDSLELDLDDPQQRDFGDYELRAQLGQGGMGVVYRAWQRSLQRDVALKLLSAGPWASPEFISRFQREAQSAARLQHPNIVPIYEIGQHAELNFFSMALVRGESLAQRLDRAGPLPPRDAARLLRTIAEALDYAHRLGILHLDLKPANILLDEAGEPQVADFGLSKRLDESLASDGDEVSGTPSYMAPEQATAKSQRIGVRTDIYGLGAILYEVLTGRPPFLGATPRLTLEQVIGRELESPRRVDGRIPEDLAAICAKCLAKDPGDRYLTARGLAEDLQRFIEGRPVTVRPLNAWQRLQRWTQREPRVALAVATALLALLAGLFATGLQWRRADANAVDARAHLWNARGQAAQSALADGDGFRGLQPLVANLAEMEADGRDADAALERQRIGTVLANAPQLIGIDTLPQGLAVTSVAIAPDASRYAIATHAGDGSRTVRQFSLPDNRELWSTPTDGLTHVMPFADGIPHGELRYSPDGSRLIVTLLPQPVLPSPQRTDSIALDAADGRVLSPPGKAHADIVFSESARVALVRYRSDPSLRFPDQGRFFDVQRDWKPLGPPRDLGTAGPGYLFLPMPREDRWLGTRDAVTLTLFDPATLASTWQLTIPANDGVRAWRFNAASTWLALGTLSGDVHLVDAGTGERFALPASPTATVRWIEFSADGRTLVALAEDGAIAAWDVATRRPRTAPLALQMVLHRMRVAFVGDALYTAAGNELRSWTLTPPAPFDNTAVPAPARLRNRRHFFANAFDANAPARLMITGGSDGTLVRWRLPPPVIQPWRAAPLPPVHQAFDGRHVVAVDGNDAWLADVASQAAAGPRLVHPEAVRVAELTSDGRWLVTVAGRTVRVFHAESGALNGAPIVLPQTPLRVEIARAAPVMALSTGDYAGDVFRETLHFIDLSTGRALPPSAPIAGMLQLFELDPLGRFALVQSVLPSGGGAVMARVEADAGAPRCTFPPSKPRELVVEWALAGDGRHAWFYTGLPKRLARLQRWDLSTCLPVATHELAGGGGAVKLRASGDDAVMHRGTSEALAVFGAQAGVQRAVGRAVEGTLSIALSADGRRAAFATRSAAHVIDTVRGERLSAPLAAPIAGNDAIAKLAFSPDGNRLVARTVRGRWLAWALPQATERVEDLATLADFLDPDGQQAAQSAPEREALQRLMIEPAPAPVPARRAPIVLAAADAATPDARFLPIDLAAAINVPLNGGWPPSRTMGGDAPTLSPGAQRLLGVDWHVQGGVQLSAGEAAVVLHPLHVSTPELPLPPTRARRVHVLAYMHIPLSPNAPPRDFLHVVLRDREGREARLAMRSVTHVATNFQPDRAAPGARIGWLGIYSATVREGTATSSQTTAQVYAAALDVPPGFGEIVSLRFDAPRGPMEAPLVYAATLERDTTDPPG